MPSTSLRLGDVDALRGIVMIVMALDHVRDFIHRGAMTSSPTDLATTTPALFFTRWITHFCAPVFLFTAGLGAFLWWRRGRSRGELSTYLLTRGLWLMLLELTVMRLAYNFNLSPSYPIFLLVLWVLGLCMVGMAALVWLPARVLAGLSLAAIALHNLFDGVRAADLGPFGWLWNLLHQVGAFPVAGTVAIVGYPLVPWIAVMALGFSAGPVLAGLAPGERSRRLAAWGAAATVAFVVLRALNTYGDPAPWSVQAMPLLTALSFLNTTKYPPSLIFLLMTLGPALLLLAALGQRQFPDRHPLIVFGRTPLFYFVLHFVGAHAVAAALALLRYGSSAWSFVFHPLPSMGGPRDLYPQGFGYDLWVAYAVWIGLVAALYPLCRWFAGVKARRRDWWVSYL